MSKSLVSRIMFRLGTLPSSRLSNVFRRYSHTAPNPLMNSSFVKISEEVQDALKANRPVVALESAIWTHGSPRRSSNCPLAPLANLSPLKVFQEIKQSLLHQQSRTASEIMALFPPPVPSLMASPALA